MQDRTKSALPAPSITAKSTGHQTGPGSVKVEICPTETLDPGCECIPDRRTPTQMVPEGTAGVKGLMCDEVLKSSDESVDLKSAARRKRGCATTARR